MPTRETVHHLMTSIPIWLTFGPTVAFAQATIVKYADLRSNERIVISANNAGVLLREKALIQRADIDTLFIQRHPMQGTWPVPTHTLRDLRVHRGSYTRPDFGVFGLVVGIPVGALLGSVFGILADDLKAAGVGAILGAAVGGAVGFKVGYGPHDRWVTVALPGRQ